MDDFDREVYCIAGLPFDAITMSKTMACLRDAIFKETPCFLTTANLNFLALAQHDADFRNSVIHSDMVVVDGMPIVWIAKLLGIPIKERVAGSNLFEAFGREQRRKITVYFFGGPDGVAAEACERINKESTGLTCVGYSSPGFGSLEEMSEPTIIDHINSSAADFLVVALGAKKGQAWIVNNRSQIKLPLVSHLGAAINFEAKRLKRAPACLQKIGLEWVWRIKEEPYLWRRYWNESKFLLRLLVSRVIPHVWWLRSNLRRLEQLSNKSLVELEYAGADCTLLVSGAILDPILPEIRSTLRQASLQNKNVQLDITDAEYLDFGFLGLLLMLKKHLDEQGLQLKVVGLRPHMRKLFDWNGLAYLIE